MAGIHASAFMNANRDEKKQPEPFKLPMPWPDEATKAEEVTEEERAELRASLQRRSAFAH